MISEQRKVFLKDLIITIILLSISSFVFYRPAWHAANLDYSPDSTERVAATINFLRNGEYKILIDGIVHPPRYEPFFSIVFFSIPLLLSSFHIGAVIYSIFTVSCIGLLIVYFFLSRLTNRLFSLTACLLVLSIPDFQLMSKKIMTDAPSAIFATIAFLIYVKITQSSNPSKKNVLFYGILCGIAFAIRSTNIFIIIPYLVWLFINRNFKDKILRFFLVTFPTCLLLILNSIYNYRTFGDFFRNGYNYWASIPYDIFSLTFNFSYFANNLAIYLKNYGIIVIFGSLIVLLFLLVKDKKTVANFNILIYLYSVIFPTLIIYLLYFYNDLRFLLGIQVTLICLITILISNNYKRTNFIFILFLIIGITLTFTNYISYQKFPLYNSFRSQILSKYLKPNSILISSIDEVYLNLRFKNLNLRIYSLDRYNEYASKMIARSKVKNFNGQDPFEHRIANASDYGLQEAIPILALEKIDYLKAQIDRNRIVLVDINLRNRDILENYIIYLKKFFLIHEIDKNLFILNNKKL